MKLVIQNIAHNLSQPKTTPNNLNPSSNHKIFVRFRYSNADREAATRRPVDDAPD